MSDLPISFSPAMVRALLSGRKSETRRLATSCYRDCRPGDRLWVRESFAPAIGPDGRWSRQGEADYVLFRDGALRFRERAAYAVDLNGFYWRAGWSQASIMPSWASRVTLIVEQVRVESLCAIDRVGAIGEGPRPFPVRQGPFWSWPGEGRTPCLSPVTAFRSAWDKMHGTLGERWEDDPEVVVLSFRLVRSHIDD